MGVQRLTTTIKMSVASKLVHSIKFNKITEWNVKIEINTLVQKFI